jgi:hypothetical protein
MIYGNRLGCKALRERSNSTAPQPVKDPVFTALCCWSANADYARSQGNFLLVDFYTRKLWLLIVFLTSCRDGAKYLVELIIFVIVNSISGISNCKQISVSTTLV